jgi:hypothetical protein
MRCIAAYTAALRSSPSRAAAERLVWNVVGIFRVLADLIVFKFGEVRFAFC